MQYAASTVRHTTVTGPPALAHILFFFNATATTEIYTLSLHDALPICAGPGARQGVDRQDGAPRVQAARRAHADGAGADRKSTRLNSSHGSISYAVFCLKKKKYHRRRNQISL